MRVSPPIISASPLEEGRQRVTVTVEFDRAEYAPEQVWIDVPDGAGPLTTSGNPWAVAFLPLAATLAEPLVVAAPVDEALLANLREMLRVWKAWYPWVSEVRVSGESSAPGHGAIRSPTGQNGDRVGSLFSGGIDSFFTLLRDRQDAHPSQRPAIQDLVTVWGFDIPLGNPPAFARLRARFQRLAAGRGQQLLDVATNLRETRWREAPWGELAHGCALAAVCHALEGRLTRVLIPATGGYRDLHPWASHPLTDPLLSSSRLVFVHDGAAAKRVEKLEVIARSEIALAELRVCWRDASDRNCGRCTKCLRTMIALQLMGAVEPSAFDRSPVTPGEASRLHCAWPWDYRELNDLVALATARERPDFARALERAMRTSRRRARLLALVGQDGRQPRGRLGRWLERLLLRGRIQ